MDKIIVKTKTDTYVFENAKIAETKGIFTIINEYKGNRLSINKKTYVKNSEIIQMTSEEND